MTEIANSTMFTNGSGRLSSGPSNLIQQAFQGVDDDEDHQNNFVAYIESDENGSQMLRLTPEAAAQFGFSVNVEGGISGEVTFLQNDGEIVSEGQSEINTEDVSNVDCTRYDEWSVQNLNQAETFQQNTIGSSLSMDTIDLSSTENCAQRSSRLEHSNDLMQVDSVLQARNISTFDKSQVTSTENCMQYTLLENQPAQSQSFVTVTNSQGQILQGLPMVIPSSQYSLKPIQPLTKPTKNVRILPSTSKVTTPVSTVHSISNGTTSSAMLFSNATLLNSVSPQVIKALPISPQFLNSNGIVNASNFLSGACEISSQSVNRPISDSMSSTLTSIVKSTISSPSTFKTAPIFTTSNIKSNSVLRTTSSVSVLKQQPKTNFAKKLVNLQSLSNISNNVQNLQKSAAMKQNIITESISERSPMSLKSQAASSQTRNVKSLQNIKPMPGMVLEKLKTSSLCAIKPTLKSAPPTSRSNTIVLTTKPILTNPCTSKPSVSKSDLSKLDNTKPLGTCKNPIPIITHSQGKTFIIDDNVPSSQINQIIQKFNREQQNFVQYNHENANSKEKVVFQIVYPNDLDLVNRSTPTVQKRPAKRGRPKKNAVRPQVVPTKPVPEEDKEVKNERKKIVARTRSGRLSRPPKHMVRDYKHLHPIDFTQPDLDDSDGGYSDYNTNGEILEVDESPKELLAGLEVTKRKVSKEYICPTCTKTYLGRRKMITHFEKNPSHGSVDQLPPLKPKSDVNQVFFSVAKPKGKKRGPWGTPEEKSDRRQKKLQNAITVCEKGEICNIAAKPVLEVMSLYDLMVLKSENNVTNFMKELKDLMDKVREKSGTMLTIARDEERNSADIVDLNDNLLCDALGLNPGLYKINNNAFRKEDICGDDEEPQMKKMKTASAQEEQNHLEERTSSGFSESSDISSSSNCPDVLTALTLMPRNPSPSNEPCKLLGSKLLISNPEIQSELCENNGFRKIDINTGFRKFDEAIAADNNEGAFLKLASTDKRFVKLETEMVSAYQNQNDESFGEIQSFETASESFSKSFQNSGENGSNIFEGLETLEVKMNYDPLAHLGMLNATGEMEQSHMTEQIEQIVSDKLEDMIPGDLLENNLMSNNSIAPDISFAFNSSLTEEYNFRSITS